ncbi:FGFR1 oncogene partner 2 -like protein [Toxocara canis]|nr:FGFR1 oncogene partner 2 -like protein [Toxocara canis]
MGTTNVSQLMAEMRQLVVNLQSRERATDGALAKSQLVNDKISSMKEYQEEVANMNGCWRMQGRKVLLAGLQQENRQILQLQQENRELRQTLEDCEGTLEIVMQKHRLMVASMSNCTLPPATLPIVFNPGGDAELHSQKTVQFSRMLQDCFLEGESMSNIDQEVIARLTTENACLRELLNISTHNEPSAIHEFTERSSASTSASRSNGSLLDGDCNSYEARDGASTPTSDSQNDWIQNNMRRNAAVVKKSPKILNDVIFAEPGSSAEARQG